jgi:peptidoglycan/LPS O-acetylase OafA/YrhL
LKVFFSISGFVLDVPFLKSILKDRPAVNLKDYFIRRVTRNEQPILVTLSLFVLVHVSLLGEPMREIMPYYLAGHCSGH